MSSSHEERRAAGVNRVEHSAVVEICGQAGGKIFQAESVNLSGRGIQVHSQHVPQVGSALVLRFNHENQEAVIEGQVAWCSKRDDGGKVGIKFTALDSPSVRVLKAIVASGGTPKRAPVEPAVEDELSRGVPVRLHLEGLGAPMKARVVEADGRGLHVGSQLEFLRMGQQIEIDTGGEHRLASIESVSVELDPDTDIPQLVLALSFDSEGELTPEPTVVDQDDVFDEDEEPESEFAMAEALFRGRVEALAGQTGAAIRAGSSRIAGEANGLLQGVKGLLQRSKSPKRTTKASHRHRPSALHGKQTRQTRSANGRRQTRAGRKGQPAPARRRNPKLWAAVGACAIFGSGAFVLFSRDHSATPAAKSTLQPALASASAGTSVPAASASVAPASPVATTASSAAAIASPNLQPGQFPPPATLNAERQAQANKHGIVANVPLFGPQAMATSEAAPVEPPKAAVVDEYGMAKDLTFASNPPALSKAAPAKEAKEETPTAPTGDKTWQVGRMHLPIVHRLRLDGAGQALQGTKTSSGFKVLIPGRKIMESGSAIAKRDDRIAAVRVKNTPAGGSVTFRFRKGIPGYKARLRKDYVEFFINSPEDKK